MKFVLKLECSSRVHRPCVHSRAQGQHRVVIVRSGESGVQDLLARDRRLSGASLENLAPELGGGPSPEEVLRKQAENEQIVKSKKQRQADIAKAAAEAGEPNRPKSCKQAIDQGLELFQKKEYQAAVDMFNAALELPGNGAYRLPGSPREYSCPSDAEENAALYNMACAYAQMGRKASSITCIEAILENDFKDFATIRGDPDLAPARGTDLDLLLFKYENPVAKAGFNLFNLTQKKPLQSDTNKPWIMW